MSTRRLHMTRLCLISASVTDIVLLYTEKPSTLQAGRFDHCKFTLEAINCAALDTCCTTTVAGQGWLRRYLSSLCDTYKEKVVGPLPGGKSFKGVSQGVLVSEAKYIIPAEIGGSPVMIEVEVVNSDIPLLLSKQSMKKAKMILYMDKDYAEIFGQIVMLDTTSAGHYVLPLLTRSNEMKTNEDQVFQVEDACPVNLLTAND